MRRDEFSRRLMREHRLSSDDLIYPVFVQDGTGREDAVPSLPGVSRKSIDRLLHDAERCMELGVPAIAFSQVQKGWGGLDAAARVARSLIERVLHQSAPVRPFLLNVNIPNADDADQRPRVVTRLGRRHASEPLIRQTSPRGDTMYWIGPAGDAREAGPGTDFHATAQGQVSVTPLQVDLTEHAALPGWGEWLHDARP